MIVLKEANEFHLCPHCRYKFNNDEADGGTYFPDGYGDFSFGSGFFGATICTDGQGNECDPNEFNKEYVFCPRCRNLVLSGKEVLYNTRPLICKVC